MIPLGLIYRGLLVAAGAGTLAAILFLILGHAEAQPDAVIYALAFH